MNRTASAFPVACCGISERSSNNTNSILSKTPRSLLRGVFNRRYLVSVALMLSLSGCAAYTELKPKPPVSSLEGDYIELTKSRSDTKMERFELKAKKKYFIRFPAPQTDNMYLTLRTDQLPLINAYFTKTFNKGKGTPAMVRDESGGSQSMRVYRIDRSVPESYWVIETVGQNFLMTLDYRYVPVWRYTFENKRDDIRNRLSRSRIDRNNYNNLGGSFHFNGYDFVGELGRVAGAYDRVTGLRTELQDLEKVFPANLLNSDDQGYRDYAELKSQVDDEIAFQENYRDVLTVFRTESDTRSNIGAFLNASPGFVTFLGQTSRFPQPMIREAQSVLGGRLSGVTPHVEQQIAAKQDASQITFGFDMNSVEALFRGCGQNPPARFLGLKTFIAAYNTEAARIAPAQAKLATAERYAEPSNRWPSNGHYAEGLNHIGELNRMIPAERVVSFTGFDQFRCVTFLNTEARRIRDRTTQLGADYATAQGLVNQVNGLKPQREYRTIIQLLAANRRLGFLLAQYPDVDQLSMEQQQSVIEVALASETWPDAERGLRSLHEDETFLRPANISGVKRAIVERMEDRLASSVALASKGRVDRFVEANKLTIDNVEGLYKDAVFTPVYTLTFTSGSAADLQARNGEVSAYLDSLKYVVLPGSAIPAIYGEFTRNIKDRGVDKARAIVTHGKNYKGRDRRIQTLVAECDPYSPKWITKPTEYRKVYALPTTANPTGENKYLIRLNVRIPSEARFPVFDVNLKLPKDIADRATTAQWYDYITLNKQPLKTEGRFTITAPTAVNNYEAQLTPVQMQADDNNILEVQFTHPSYQVFEISTMSQRPIMRKD